MELAIDCIDWYRVYTIYELAYHLPDNLNAMCDLCSDYCAVLSGVRILGPLTIIFGIFINDLPLSIVHSTPFHYADDSKCNSLNEGLSMQTTPSATHQMMIFKMILSMYPQYIYAFVQSTLTLLLLTESMANKLSTRFAIKTLIYTSKENVLIMHDIWNYWDLEFCSEDKVLTIQKNKD